MDRKQARSEASSLEFVEHVGLVNFVAMATGALRLAIKSTSSDGGIDRSRFEGGVHLQSA